MPSQGAAAIVCANELNWNGSHDRSIHIQIHLEVKCSWLVCMHDFESERKKREFNRMATAAA